MKTEQEIVQYLEKNHISDLQSEVYKHSMRHILNASDVVNAVKLLYLMGFKIVKNGK